VGGGKVFVEDGGSVHGAKVMVFGVKAIV